MSERMQNNDNDSDLDASDVHNSYPINEAVLPAHHRFDPSTAPNAAASAANNSNGLALAAAIHPFGVVPMTAPSAGDEILAWQPVNGATDHFSATTPLHGLSAEFTLPPTSSLCDIFLHFVPETLITRIFESYPDDHWTYTSGNARGKVMQGRCNVRAIYQYFAIYIRSLALLEVPATSSSSSTMTSFPQAISSSGPIGNNASNINSNASSSAAAAMSSDHTVNMNIEPFRVSRKRGRPSATNRVYVLDEAQNFLQQQLQLQRSQQQQQQQAQAPTAVRDIPLDIPTDGNININNNTSSGVAMSAEGEKETRRPLRKTIIECLDYFIVRMSASLLTANAHAISNPPASVNGNSSLNGQAPMTDNDDTTLMLAPPVSLASSAVSSNSANTHATGAAAAFLSPQIDKSLPGYDTIEKFWSRFHIREPFFNDIFANFQSVLASPGDYLVSNEHLLYFQGQTNQIQFAVNRAIDKHGMYLFTVHSVLRDPFAPMTSAAAAAPASASLSMLSSTVSTSSSSAVGGNGGGTAPSALPPPSISNSFLLHAKLCYANPKQGRSSNPQEQLATTLSLYSKFRSQNAERSRTLKLLLNHFAVAEDSIDMLQGIPHLALAGPNRCHKLLHVLVHRCGKLRQRGDVCAMQQERQRELCFAHWDGDSWVGKRNYVTNLFQRIPTVMNTTNGSGGVVSGNGSAATPNVTVNAAVSAEEIDRRMEPYLPVTNGAMSLKMEDMNQTLIAIFRYYGNVLADEMHPRRVCHKTGGRSKLGQDGQEHKLIMALILHNTFAAYQHIQVMNVPLNQREMTEQRVNQSFAHMCMQLADELFDHSMNL